MSAGKGSKPRPVDLAKYQANYDAIFRKSSEDVAALYERRCLTSAEAAHLMKTNPSALVTLMRWGHDDFPTAT